MSWGQFLFSPNGRINRARYWGALAIQYGILITTWLPAIVIFDDKSGDPNSIAAVVYVVVAILISCAFVLSHFFAQVNASMTAISHGRGSSSASSLTSAASGS